MLRTNTSEEKAVVVCMMRERERDGWVGVLTWTCKEFSSAVE